MDVKNLYHKDPLHVLLSLDSAVEDVFSAEDSIRVSTSDFSFCVTSVKYEYNRLLLTDANGNMYNLAKCNNPVVTMPQHVYEKYTNALLEVEAHRKYMEDEEKRKREEELCKQKERAKLIAEQEERDRERLALQTQRLVLRNKIDEHRNSVVYIDEYSRYTEYGNLLYTGIGQAIHDSKYNLRTASTEYLIGRLTECITSHGVFSYAIPAPSSTGSHFVHYILQRACSNTGIQFLDCIGQNNEVKSVKDVHHTDTIGRYSPRKDSYFLKEGLPDLNNEKVLVFDDMISTGATSYAIRRLLESSFPSIRIKFIVLARTRK
ncbi:TPA: hypothetical protein ACPDKD_000413 [Pasteurella multocida]|nr:phosphoribosyltransferase [Pasteurella multocida]